MRIRRGFYEEVVTICKKRDAFLHPLVGVAKMQENEIFIFLSNKSN
jgi:hypothetical protein